ncbi:unnamed protein product [Amoebophrya sp. A120]|nr:unnamed protein product [Amoebophrya sp. A120]|eukprot:GSA120T00001684001.1
MRGLVEENQKFRNMLLYQQTEFCSTQLNDHITCVAHEDGDLAAFGGFAKDASRNWAGVERWYAIHYPNALWVRPDIHLDFCCGLPKTQTDRFDLYGLTTTTSTSVSDYSAEGNNSGNFAAKKSSTRTPRWHFDQVQAVEEEEQGVDSFSSTLNHSAAEEAIRQDGTTTSPLASSETNKAQPLQKAAAPVFEQARVSPNCEISSLGRQSCVHDGMCLTHSNRMLMYAEDSDERHHADAAFDATKTTSAAAGRGKNKNKSMNYFGQLLLAPWRSTPTWDTRANPRTVHALEKSIGFDFPRGFTWDFTWKNIAYGWRLLRRRSRDTSKTKTSGIKSEEHDQAQSAANKMNTLIFSSTLELPSGNVVTNIWHVLELLYGVFYLSTKEASFESIVFADPAGAWTRQTEVNQKILRMVFSTFISLETRRLVKILNDGGRVVYYRDIKQGDAGEPARSSRSTNTLYDSFFEKVFFDVYTQAGVQDALRTFQEESHHARVADVDSSGKPMRMSLLYLSENVDESVGPGGREDKGEKENHANASLPSEFVLFVRPPQPEEDTEDANEHQRDQSDNYATARTSEHQEGRSQPLYPVVEKLHQAHDLHRLHSCFDGRVHFPGTGSITASGPRDGDLWRQMLQAFFPGLQQGRFHVLFSLRESQAQYKERTSTSGKGGGLDENDNQSGAAQAPQAQEPKAEIKASAVNYDGKRARIATAPESRIRFGREIVNQDEILERVRDFLRGKRKGDESQESTRTGTTSGTQLKIHYGYEPFEEQLALFAGAGLLVHVFGQASAWMAFMPKDAMVLLLYPEKTMLETYYGTTNSAVFREVQVDRVAMPLRLYNNQDEKRHLPSGSEIKSLEPLCDLTHPGRHAHKLMYPWVHSEVWSVMNVSAGILSIRTGPHYEFLMRHCSYVLDPDRFMRKFQDLWPAAFLHEDSAGGDGSGRGKDIERGRSVSLRQSASFGGEDYDPARPTASPLSTFFFREARSDIHHDGQAKRQCSTADWSPTPLCRLDPAPQSGTVRISLTQVLQQLGMEEFEPRTNSALSNNSDGGTRTEASMTTSAIGSRPECAIDLDTDLHKLVPAEQHIGLAGLVLFTHRRQSQKPNSYSTSSWDLFADLYGMFRARMRHNVRSWRSLVLIEEVRDEDAEVTSTPISETDAVADEDVTRNTSTSESSRVLFEMCAGQKLAEFSTLVKIFVHQKRRAVTVVVYRSRSRDASSVTEENKILLPRFRDDVLLRNLSGRVSAEALVDRLARHKAGGGEAKDDDGVEGLRKDTATCGRAAEEDSKTHLISAGETGEEIQLFSLQNHEQSQSAAGPSTTIMREIQFESRARLVFAGDSSSGRGPETTAEMSEQQDERKEDEPREKYRYHFPASGMRDAHYWRAYLSKAGYVDEGFRRMQVVLDLTPGSCRLEGHDPDRCEGAGTSNPQDTAYRISAVAQKQVRDVIQNHLSLLHDPDGHYFFIAPAKSQLIDLTQGDALAAGAGAVPSAANKSGTSSSGASLSRRMQIFSQCAVYVTTLTKATLQYAAFMPEHAIVMLLYPPDVHGHYDRSGFFSFLHSLNLAPSRFRGLTSRRPVEEDAVAGSSTEDEQLHTRVYDINVEDFLVDFRLAYSQSAAYIHLSDYQMQHYGRQASDFASTCRSSSSTSAVAGEGDETAEPATCPADRPLSWNQRVGKYCYVDYDSLVGKESALKQLVHQQRAYVWERELMKRLDLEQIAIEFQHRVQTDPPGY